MVRLVVVLVLIQASVLFADKYRLLDTPRCAIDLDVPNNIVNVSKCPVFHDQYYGDQTFSAGIACHDAEGLNAEKTILIVPKSIKESSKGDSYFEITERTNYSFKVDFVVKIVGRDPAVFPSETFFEWVRSGRVDECEFRLESPKKVKKISK